jgi:hypothetical protein
MTGAPDVRRRVIWTALFALVVHTSVVAVKTFTHPAHTVLAVFRVGGLNPRQPAFVARDGYPTERDGYGTDGQQYLFVAHDPLVRGTEMARALDEPRYRYGRILLPALAAVTCGGNSACLPRAIVGYNLVFAAAVGALLASLVAERRAHPLWAAALAASGPLVLATDIGNIEVCAQCFGLAGVVLASRDRAGLAAAAFACAALSRESYALVAIGFALSSALDRRASAAAMYLAACAPIALWMLYLRAVLPGPMGAASNLGPPFVGIGYWIADLVRHPRVDTAVFNRIAAGAPLLAMMARHTASLRRDRSGLAIAAALVSALGIAATAGVWRSPGGFARAMDFVYPGTVLPALARNDRVTPWLSLSSLVLTISTIGDHLVRGAPL